MHVVYNTGYIMMIQQWQQQLVQYNTFQIKKKNQYQITAL